jgi:threonylcarbamoyladenosine tRNA methylthiotransferase MtaB
MASLSVRTFGCRANQAEAFAWADAFHDQGLRLETDWDRSDVIVVNSCAVTARAERDARKFIRGTARTNPGARIVVTGCYAERAPGELAALPGVIAVLPQSAKAGLAGRIMEIDGMRAGPSPEGHREFRARAWLKVQDGCDARCAFCVIPSVRGGGRSVAPEDVAGSVRSLAGRGFQEIVLAGIHLSSYGDDLAPRSSLGALVEGLRPAAGKARLRLSSLDPRRTDAALARRLAESEGICPHFHLSLQHASSTVLRAMGRATDEGTAGSLLDELARLAPEAALGADLLVGFPGETDDDFETLRRFLERSALTYAHVFPYSPRSGTPAADRPQLPAGVIASRAKSLRRAAALKDLRFRGRFLGRTLEAVVIDRRGREAEVMTGNAVRVAVPACAAPRGTLVRVVIRRVLPDRTEGEIAA